MKYLRPLFSSVAAFMRLEIPRSRRSPKRQMPEWAHRMARAQARAR